MKNASLKWVLSATVAAAMLAACGGGVSPAPTSTNVNTSLTAANAVVMAGTPYSFASGIPALGTAAATDLTVTGSGAATTFSLASDGMTASGPMTFGSCIFTIAVSSFAADHPLGRGKVVTVNPCTLAVRSAGFSAGTQSVPTVLTMGTSTSAPNNRTVIITSTGGVTIGAIILTGGAS